LFTESEFFDGSKCLFVEFHCGVGIPDTSIRERFVDPVAVTHESVLFLKCSLDRMRFLKGCVTVVPSEAAVSGSASGGLPKDHEGRKSCQR
jgi:hypothetical protein